MAMSTPRMQKTVNEIKEFQLIQLRFPKFLRFLIVVFNFLISQVFLPPWDFCNLVAPWDFYSILLN